jgi:hypothetical protein
MQLAKSGDVWCERRAIRVAQVTQGICRRQTQAYIAQRRHYVAQDGKQGFA